MIFAGKVNVAYFPCDVLLLYIINVDVLLLLVFCCLIHLDKVFAVWFPQTMCDELNQRWGV